MTHFLKHSERDQITPLLFSSGQTRDSAKESLQHSWEPTQYREPLGSKPTAFPLEVSQLAHPTVNSSIDPNIPRRPTRQHSQQVGRKLLRADSSQDCASRRLQIRCGCEPREPKHNLRRGVHRVCQRRISVGQGVPVVDVQAKRPRSLGRHYKESTRLHWHCGLRPALVTMGDGKMSCFHLLKHLHRHRFAVSFFVSVF
jgi:hypothetical protein